MPFDDDRNIFIGTSFVTKLFKRSRTVAMATTLPKALGGLVATG